VLAAVAVTLIFVSAASAAIRITKVQYDSPGSDTGSNSSLNAEWVKIKNTGSHAKTLTGWTLRDTSSHVYHFGSFRLGAGSSVQVHTGSGSNTRHDRYWGSGWYVWNNTGDTAKLKNRSGRLIDRCSWGDGSGVKYC